MPPASRIAQRAAAPPAVLQDASQPVGLTAVPTPCVPNTWRMALRSALPLSMTHSRGAARRGRGRRGHSAPPRRRRASPYTFGSTRPRRWPARSARRAGPFQPPTGSWVRRTRGQRRPPPAAAAPESGAAQVISLVVDPPRPAWRDSNPSLIFRCRPSRQLVTGPTASEDATHAAVTGEHPGDSAGPRSRWSSRRSRTDTRFA